MPNLADLAASPLTKALVIGDSGSGKTGCLAALVKAGYEIFLLDMDNGWQSLAEAIKRTCPERISAVHVETYRDKVKATATGIEFDGQPTAAVRAAKILDRWVDSATGQDFGSPAQFGPNSVLCLDSLTHFSNAVLYRQFAMNPSAGMRGGPDPRALYKNAQDYIEKMMMWLTADWFDTNVIVNAHIQIQELPDGRVKGMPISAGQALSPKIPTYFNTLLMTRSMPGGKRYIHTVSDALFDLKNPKPFSIKDKYEIETGMLEIFQHLGDQCSQQSKSPKSSTPRIAATTTSSDSSPAPTGIRSLQPIGKP